ncbi:uncharacterized protein LOC112450509 [Kryptolebias marmoratus]|uniref:uncharacterized protein LOC112450509 n=1 Tax=Kryptolebias marmoratus TaxID=37003 RepID=UPI000D52F485|nr:uncharacterized protein LOC112450509 [Kryptolebias marmoratus]
MAGRVFIIILICSFCEMQKQALPQAKLRVYPPVIKETESVSLSCEAPSHVSVHQCYFYVNGGTQTLLSCVKTFTGSDLLRMSWQTSPAVVEVRCFYSVKIGRFNLQSPHSDSSYITIGLKPQMSMNHFKGDQTIFTCSLPGSVKHDTTCHLYFGEANHPAETKNIMKTRSSKTNQWFCQFFIPEGDLLRRLQSVQQKDASCDYSLEDDGKVLSPRSDPYDLTGLVKSESVEIKTTQMFTTSVFLSSGQAVPEPPTSAGVTTVQVTSANHNPTTNTTSDVKATENVGSGVDSSGGDVVQQEVLEKFSSAEMTLGDAEGD